MKLNRLSLTASLACVLLVAGCAATPEQRLARTELAVQAAIDATDVAVNAGVLDKHPETLRSIKQGNAYVRVAMANARAYVASGDKDNADLWLQRVLLLLAQLNSARSAGTVP